MFTKIKTYLLAIAVVSPILFGLTTNSNLGVRHLDLDLRNTSQEENYPGHLEVTYNSSTKKLSITPQNVPNNIKPYLALQLKDDLGRNLLTVNRKNNQTEIEANNLGAIRKSTISGYELKDIVELPPNKDYILYQLDQDNRVHSTKLSGGFWNTKSVIIPTTYLTNPGVDKFTNNTIDECIFAKPNFDGKNYAWKGDMMFASNGSIATGYDSKFTMQFRLKFDQFPNNGEVFYEYSSEKLQMTMALKDKKIVFTQKYDTKVRTMTLSKELTLQKWHAITFISERTTPQIYIDGLYEGTTGAGSYNFTNNQTKFYLRKKSGNWAIADVMIWNKKLNNAEIEKFIKKLPTPNDAGIVGFFDMDENSGTQILNSKQGTNVIATLSGDCQKDWIVGQYQYSEPPKTRKLVKINPTTGNAVNTCSGFGKISGLDLKKTSFTIEFLARRSKLKKHETVFSQGNLQATFHGDNSLSIKFGNNELRSKPLEDTDKWSHYAFVCNASTNMRKVYHNGILIAKDNQLINSYNESGVFNFGNNNGSSPFQGQIDEFRIWKTIRSQKDIKKNMTIPLGGQPANLFFYSKFEKLENGAAYNEVTQKNDLKGTGLFLNKVDDAPCKQAIPKIRPQTGKVVNFCTGGFRGGRYIDGINIANKSFTIEFLARTSEQREHTILSQKERYNKANKNELLNIILKPNNQLHFGFHHNDLVSKPDTTGMKDWNHWALVYDHTIKKRKIYRNGQLIATDLKPIDPYKGSGRIYLGYMPDNSKPFKGQLDELRIWNTTRTQDDIQKNMEKPLVGKSNGLLVYTKFETLSGNYRVPDETNTYGIYCQLATLTNITDAPCSNANTLPFNTGKVLELCGGKFEFDVKTLGAGSSFTIEFLTNTTPSISLSKTYNNGGYNRLGVTLDHHGGFISLGKSYYMHAAGVMVKQRIVTEHWTHYAFSYDANSKKGKLYQDGRLIEETFGKGYNIALDFNGTWKMPNYPAPFKGKIDELRIWNSALYDRHFSSDAFNSISPNRSIRRSLMYYYKFEKPLFNGKAYNEITKTYDGRVSNGSIVEPFSSPCQPTTTPKLSKLNTGKVLNLCNQQPYESETPIDLANQSFTIEFLAKRSNTTGEDYVLGLGTKHEKNKMLHVGFDGDDVRMGFLANTLYANGKGNDQWNHWAFVYDHNAKRRIIYRNGNEIGSDKTDPFIGQGKLIFGRIEINVAKHGFDGQLDEFRIWKSVRSEQEIKDNMTKPLTTVPKELAVYYKFEKLNNDKAYNEAAKKEDITLKQAFLSPSNAAPCPTPPSLSKVATGNALNFCTTGDEATIKNVNINNSFTIEFLAKRSQTNTIEQIIQHGTGNSQLAIGFKKNNALSFAWGGKELTTALGYLGNTKTLNHWAFVYDARSKKRTIYLNGAAIATDQQVIAPYNGTGDLTIGKGFQGQLDEFRVWKTARSAQEIKDNAPKTLTTIPNMLLAYSKFEQLNRANLYNEVTKKVDIATSAALNDLNKKPCEDLKGLQLKTGNVLNLCNGNGGKIQGNVDIGSPYQTVEFLGRLSDLSGTILTLANGQTQYLKLSVQNNNLVTTGHDGRTGSVTIDKEWHHWAVTFVFYGNLTRYRIFKDGIFQRSFDAKKINSGSYYEIVFGDFKGQIDELRIWSEERGDADIKANAFISLKNLSYSLRFYSKFEKLEKGKAYDEVSKKYNLIFQTAGLNKATDAPCSNAMGYQKISSITPTTGNTLSFCNSDVAEIAPIDLAKKSFTVEFLAKRSKTKKAAFPIQQGSYGKNKKLHIGFRGNDKFTLAFNGNDLNTPTTVKNLSEWNHWACVYDHSNKTRRIYQNGSLLAEDKNVVPYEGTGKLLIGENFEGQLDELRIWKTVRTEKEIKDNATKALATVSNDLFFYSKFEKLTDGKAYNEVTKKEDIACKRLFINKLNEDVCYNSKGVLSKQALYLDGKDTYIASDQPIDLTNKSFTVEFWAEKENDGTVFSHGDPAKKEEYIAFKATEGGLHHYTYVYDKVSKTILQYVDGLPKKMLPVSDNYKGTTAKAILGRNKEGGTNFDSYKGKLDEVRVWDRLFNPTQVKDKLYLGKFGANTPNLLPYYDFETFSGKTIPDVTNKNNGQLSFFGNPRYALASVDLKLVTNAAPSLPTTPTDKAYNAATQGDKNFKIPQRSKKYLWVMFWAKMGNDGTREIKLGNTANNTLKIGKGQSDRITSTLLQDNKWHHIALKIEHDYTHYDKLTGFVDGKEVGKIGHHIYTTSTCFNLKGAIVADDLVAFQTDKTDFDPKKEEAKLPYFYQSNSNILKILPYPIHYWETFDANGTDTPHSNKKVGDADQGKAWFNPIKPTPPKTAINFDGNDDHITLPEINLRNSFTIAFLAKNERPNDYGFLFSQGPVNNGVKQRKLLRIGFWNDNRFYFDFFGEDLRTSAKYTDTDWHHWIMTYDASTKKQAIYRDGQKVASRTATANFQGSGPIRIGASIQNNSSGNPRFMFKGSIGNLIVIPTALSSSSDITNLSKGIIPKNQQQQSYYFDFNEGKGSEINSKLKPMKGILKNMDLNKAWILRK